MNAIEVKNLTKEYSGLRALDRVSFEVRAGEIFGFLGPNGAGKTTTIRILTGQLRPTSGRAWVMGWDVVEEREMLKPLIGVVFEYQNLYQRLSARIVEKILNIKIQGLSGRSRLLGPVKHCDPFN